MPRPPLSESFATADVAAFRSDVSTTAEDAAFRSGFSATADATAFRSGFPATADAGAFRRDLDLCLDSLQGLLQGTQGIVLGRLKGDRFRDHDLCLMAPLCSALVSSLLRDLDRRLRASLCCAFLSGILLRRSGVLCSCDLSRCRSLPRLSERSLSFFLLVFGDGIFFLRPETPYAPSPRREEAPSPRREEGVPNGFEPKRLLRKTHSQQLIR
jgi:hypothetical protein